MLKIKDNIDLKELEKFELNPIIDDWTDECLGWRWTTIYNDDGEEIEVELYVYPDGNRYAREMVIECGTEEKLFDLIQAGLVEKVENKG